MKVNKVQKASIKENAWALLEIVSLSVEILFMASVVGLAAGYVVYMAAKAVMGLF